MITFKLIVFSVLILALLGQKYRYVTPKTSSDIICPSQPCLSLGEFMEVTEIYFTTGSTFVFLPGNHSLESSLHLTNVSDIILRGAEGGSTSQIFLGSQVSIMCDEVANFHIEGLTFVLCKYQCEESALQFLNSVDIVISYSTFHGSGNETLHTMKSVYSEHSNFTILNSLFEGNTGFNGGAIESWNGSVITISGSTFVGNRATFGGAISAVHSTILMEGNYFEHNEAVSSSGALECDSGTLILAGRNRFNKNKCSNYTNGYGGAMSVLSGEVIFSASTAVFTENEAYEGGAILLYESVLSCDSPSTVTLDRNRARFHGGAFSSRLSNMKARKCYLNITNNFAEGNGGGVSIGETNRPSEGESQISGSFTNNTAKYVGGAMYIQNEKNITLRSVNMTGNSKTALYVFNSVVNLRDTRWTDNEGDAGGGVFSQNSILSFGGYCLFEGNTAHSGGAFFLLQGTASFEGVTLFTDNTALFGGALFADGGTFLKIQSQVEFMYNRADNGGAIFLNNGGSIIMGTNGYLNFSFNEANRYGGGIYHQDNASPSQCFYVPDAAVPFCFIQVDAPESGIPKARRSFLYSHGDSAGRDGNFLYGGLLDRCTLLVENTELLSFLINGYDRNHTSLVSSEPYALCLCSGSNQHLNCTGSVSISEIHRGQKFSISLVAIAQGNTATSTSVTATVSSTANLKIQQSTQHLPPYCFNLSYNVYSTEEDEKVTLHPKGPCHDTGFASVDLTLTLLPCPDGFALGSSGQCVCEEKLSKYNVSCTIDEDILLSKKAGSGFWMGAEYENGSYRGLILYKTCPIEYCRTDEVNITIRGLDLQCAHGRIGLLCGGCAGNYSLSMGSSTCRECSNTYLALLLPFAAAGIALVAFLSILRLTVASGMINSLILYANIVQVNRKLFFPANTVNILTVFVAWLNLDLGFDTCFFHGMDAFAQTCLQFAFPVYVWVLISLIILTSRYSITVSKLIGHNPIAVLATLLLMSYNKILKIIIEVYSSVKLDYPQNRTVTVWLKDANVSYLQSRHLALTAVTSLLLVFLFLPYTLLLLLGHKLYRLSGRKYFGWFNKMKPLLDSYYAPYKIRTRYWTGFLLLARCALYIVFSFNSLGGTRESLLAIILTFTAVGFAVGFVYRGRIYRSTAVNILEASVYLNLVTVSALALAGTAHLTVLVYCLIGIVLATLVGVIAYHFHTQYSAKSALWVKLGACLFRHPKNPAELDPSNFNANAAIPHKFVSKTVIDLREPLLET